jgi:NAD(P)-dependent dehydrogenase (short-subunit alcohol dehydrogenase family)
MRPLQEQTILITGSTDGLGKLVAQDLAGSGAMVLLHGRDPEKGKAVLKEIEAASGNRQIKYYNADLASLGAVSRLAQKIIKDHKRLDVLVNNAGVGPRSPGSRRELSADGYELRFAVNYLSHFLLTHKLLPLIMRSAPARIINVASRGQHPLDFDDIMTQHDYDDLRAYRRSKLAQIMFTFDLAEELKGTGVTVNSLHPASLMNTKMGLGARYFSTPLTTVEQGAGALEYLVVSADLEGVTGEYFNGKERSPAHEQAYDREARRRLRELSEMMTGLNAARRKERKDGSVRGS